MKMKPHTTLKLKITTNNTMLSPQISPSVEDTLLSAQRQGRLTCGVYESAKLLQTDPCGVMLCILPVNMERDITLQMQYTLIQAYCWENDIGVIKVDSSIKLNKLLSGSYGRPKSEDEHSESITDVNCVLVQYPEDACSESEDDVLEYCRVTCDLNPMPIIPLGE